MAAAFIIVPAGVLAAEYTSTSFKVIDPVITVGGGRSTSDSFRVEQTIGQPAVGISTSASFQIKGGFLFFTAPSAAAEAAAAEAAAAGGGGAALFPSRIVFPADLLAGLLPARIPAVCPAGFRESDLDCDGSVGLIDLSIFLFLQNRGFPNRADFNRDADINSRDFSILLTDWSEQLLSFAPEPPSGSRARIEGPFKLGESEAEAGEAGQVAFTSGAPIITGPGAFSRLVDGLNQWIENIYARFRSLLDNLFARIPSCLDGIGSGGRLGGSVLEAWCAFRNALRAIIPG